MEKSNSSTFVPRVGLQRILKYPPKYLRTFSQQFFYAGIFALLPAIFFTALDIRQGKFTWDSLLLLLLSIGIGFVGLVARLTQLTSVEVSPEMLTISVKDKIINIAYAEIKSLKYSSLSDFWGWFTIETSNGKKYRFTTALDRAEYVVESIYNGNPRSMTPEQMARLRNIAIIASQTTSFRMESILSRSDKIDLLLTPLVFVALAALARLAMGKAPSEISLQSYMSLLVVIYLVNLVVNRLALLITFKRVEKLTQDRIKKSPTNVIRDLQQEQRILRTGRKTYYGVMTSLFVALIVVKAVHKNDSAPQPLTQIERQQAK